MVTKAGRAGALVGIAGAVALALSSGSASAQVTGADVASAATQSSDADLAKQLANPIANLISVPLQFNYDDGYGADGDGERGFVNIQPVIPIDLNADWLMISRTILPVIHQDDIFPTAGSQSGFGDITQSLFFSPKTGSQLTWGVGPAFLLPTASDDLLGTGKWGAGPTGVALYQSGPWTVGGLANHIWSFAGDEDRPDVNQTFVQPFLNYTLPSATSFYLNTESTYNWEAEQWSVPINFGVNQLVKLGNQRVQIGGGLRYWADTPETGPEGWGARVNVVFLFPR